MSIQSNIDNFVTDLLHLSDTDNKLIDLNSGAASQTFRLYHDEYGEFYLYMIKIILNHIGKIGNTVMKQSARAEHEQILGKNVNSVMWSDSEGNRDVKVLDKFIANVYKEISLKGNNPLFLSIGALNWRIEFGKNKIKDVSTPLLIFPIRLIRAEATSPISIEFIDDDINLNPCLTNKLKQILGETAVKGFPHPNGATELDAPINISVFDDYGESYFNAVDKFVKDCCASDSDTLFSFDKNRVAISCYSHSDLCMYYDIKRNRDTIYEHSLVKKIFGEKTEQENRAQQIEPMLVLPSDNVQEEMIRAVTGGESLIIKGPPGTGKTLTIANMIAALLSSGKKILLSSKKVSALTEVYAKLPESIRKFVMLLSCETERDAALLKPSEIKKNLNALLADRKEYTALSSKFYADYESSKKKCVGAMTWLSDYCDVIFKTNQIAGSSYYEAIDTYCKNECNVIHFADGKTLLNISRSEYNQLYSEVRDIGQTYMLLTDNFTHGIYKNPWYTSEGDVAKLTEDAFNDCRKIVKDIETVLISLDGALLDSDVPYGKLTVSDVMRIVKRVLSDEVILKLICNKTDDFVLPLRKALAEYKKSNLSALNDFEIVKSLQLYELNDSLNKSKCDLTLTVNLIKDLHNEYDLFYHALMQNGAKTKQLCNLIADCTQKRKSAINDLSAVFKGDLIEPNAKLLQDAVEVLSQYDAQDKIKFLDFKAKAIIKKLKSLCIFDDTTLKDILCAVKKYEDIIGLDTEISNNEKELTRIFARRLTAKQLQVLYDLFAKSADCNTEAVRYLAEVEQNYELFDKIFNSIKNSRTENYTIKMAQNAIQAQIKYYNVYLCVEKICNDLQITDVDIDKNCIALATNINAIYNFYTVFESVCKDKDGIDEKCAKAVNLLADAIQPIASKLTTVFEELKQFGDRHFNGYYSLLQEEITFNDFRLYAKEAINREVLSAAQKYIKALQSSIMRNFFAPFERGEEKTNGTAFEDIFEHSFYSLACNAYASGMGNLRNGLSANIISQIESYCESEADIREHNVKFAEKKCIESIDAQDPEFRFLQAERDTTTTLRRLFKNHAKAILKLKKCFILSPSTASVLFSQDDYSDFDIVIVDEASQLEPTAILPVLFRAKQCVLVGDEYQMPPIKHFVSMDERKFVDNTGETVMLDTDTSALGLALHSEAFKTRQLQCHYRSNTESLILFSQKRFYPYMRTFPTTEPKRADLGLFNIYVEDGYCENGINKAEAKQTVDWIERHFAEYYDEYTCVLKQSFGVVAFGKEQIEYIKSLVERNKELNLKIKNALANFKDVEEKLIFFKTIETVQGQETDHLVLSLTYGKKSDGSVYNNFGELNRGNLGGCIFNVAVTRAKSSLTLIHSVNSYDITSPNVEYIKEYIEIVERFGENSKNQFVSGNVTPGFIKRVRDFVISNGIAPERIVYDYGVTDGSLKIPLAILSEDLKRAQLGIWCEKPLKSNGNYLDDNVKYYNVLLSRGWNLYRIYAHDWMDNCKSEQAKLKEILKKYILGE